MKSPMRVLCILGLGAGMTTIDAARPARADGHCQKVSGAIAASITTAGCASPVGLCTAGEFTGDGLLNGTTAFVADGLAVAAGMPVVVPPSTLSYSGHLTITTKKGTLTLIDTGIFDTAAGRFSSLDEEAGGTGPFAGATARLFIYGTGTSDFESKVTGEVCLAG